MLGIDYARVEDLINAFVECSSDDPDKLARLLDVLEKEDAPEGRKIGLGYVVTHAKEKIKEKLQFIQIARRY